MVGMAYVKSEIPTGLSKLKYEYIEELLLDYKFLISRWNQVKNDNQLKKKFCSRNRNPLFDISGCRFFKTNLGSLEGIKVNNPVYDHYIQRTKAVELIFRQFEVNPDIEITEFIRILRKYCSVVALTKEEHKKVTIYCKKHPEVFNYQAYEACGIRIQGLSELILS